MASVAQILERKHRRRALLQHRVTAILDQLKQLGAVKVILFGSLARDRADICSDIDLLVVMPPPRSGKEWASVLYAELERGVATDLVVYNEDEFRALYPRRRSLRHMVTMGKVLYDKAA